MTSEQTTVLSVMEQECLLTLKHKLTNEHKTTFEDSFSEEIWRTTYKDHADVTIDDTFFRVASAIASVEDTMEKRLEWTEKFYMLLHNFTGVPGGRILSNAGTEWKGTTLINCFVAPRESYDIDSLEGILRNLRNQSFTLKAEGGYGENFSYIRPRGSFIYGIGVESPGAVKYMELFDKSSEIITSGSGKKSTNVKGKKKIRKGAMMALLDCWHPDIVEFITAKQQPGRLTKFNMSVNCTDEFMQRVNRVVEINNQVANTSLDMDLLIQERELLDKWELVFPDTQHPAYKQEWDGTLKNWKDKGYPVIVYNTVSVMGLWNLIMESTFNRAEPGVVFLDRANHYNPLNYAETIVGTNPCLSGTSLIVLSNGELLPMATLVEQVQQGNEIYVQTYNIGYGKQESKLVTAAFCTKKDAEVITIELDTGNKLTLTPDHLVYTKNRGYVKACELTEVDELENV